MRREPHYLAEPHRDVREVLDDPGLELPGWPGYRTRPGRTGYDPIDYQIEAAQMTGRMIKMLATGRYYTQHPFFFLMLLILGPGIVYMGHSILLGYLMGWLFYISSYVLFLTQDEITGDEY